MLLGSTVGVCDGADVGSNVGTRVGLAVGLALGALVGITVGLAVGAGVGNGEGGNVMPMGCEDSDPAQLRKDNGLKLHAALQAPGHPVPTRMQVSTKAAIKRRGRGG